MTPRILLTLLLLLLNDFSFSQTPKKAEKSKNITSLTDSLIQLKNQLSILKDSIENKINNQKEAIEQSTSTLTNQNSLISSFGVIYTIITIVIAIMGIALPILTYQFGIKPSQDALKDFEKNIDNRLENYLKLNRDNQVKKSIEYLQGENLQLKNHAANYLSLTQYDGFSNEQLFQLYNLVISNKLNDLHLSSLAFVLSSHQSIYSDQLFTSSNHLKKPAIKQMAYIYFSRTGLNEIKINSLIEILEGKSKSEQLSEFSILLSNLKMYGSKEMVLEVLNNEAIINILKPEVLSDLSTSKDAYLGALNLTDKELQHTLIWSTMNRSK